MKFIILVSCFIVVRADGITDDVYIDGVRHQTEKLVNNVSSIWPWILAVDYNYNNLYFLIKEQPVILCLNTSEYRYIDGVTNARSLTVDQGTHDLYIGTTKGIYKYKPSKGVAELYGAKGDYISSMFFKEALFYHQGLSGSIYTLNNGHSDKVENLQYDVYGLVIDNENVMWFSNGSGLYSQQRDSYRATLYYDEDYVMKRALDRNGKVYFTAANGIYEVIKYNATVRRVATIQSIIGLAFDNNNNIIYCDDNNIFRLKPIADGNGKRNCSDRNDPLTNGTNENKTTEIEQQQGHILDILQNKIDKLFIDQSEQKKMLQSMDRKINDVSQKIDKLVIGHVERKLAAKDLDKQTEKPLTSQVEERLHYNVGSPRIININISN